jgi:putative hydrolase of the HAD superfamily
MKNIKALGLDALVDVILVSEAEGLRKPDAALFQRAADRLEVKADQCFFVGDNPAADIPGAHGAGMRTAWLSAGDVWPHALAPNPSAGIGKLAQVLALV